MENCNLREPLKTMRKNDFCGYLKGKNKGEKKWDSSVSLMKKIGWQKSAI